MTTTAKRGQPIADKLIKKMNRYIRGKVVDLNAVLVGRKNAEELQKTVATREDLADLHPAHAIYVYAQNQASVMAEQLTSLKEMDRFVKVVSRAEDEYMPDGPPLSPLTSYTIKPSASETIAKAEAWLNKRHWEDWG